MAFGPFYATLPVDGSGRHYVDQTSWDRVISNFSTWAGDVNGGAHALANLSNLGVISDGTPGGHLVNVLDDRVISDSNLGSQLNIRNSHATINGHASLILDKGDPNASATIGFNTTGTAEWDMGAIDSNDFVLRSLGGTNPKSFMVAHGAPTNSIKIEASGGVRMQSLPSSNPGAGTKQLWYDPSDGNRVKFAP